jgi:hypothetical protein
MKSLTEFGILRIIKARCSGVIRYGGIEVPFGYRRILVIRLPDYRKAYCITYHYLRLKH